MKKLTTLLALSTLVLLLPACGGKSYPTGEPTGRAEVTEKVNNIKGLHYIKIGDFSFEQLAEKAECPTLPFTNTQVRRDILLLSNINAPKANHATYVLAIGETPNHLGSVQVCGMMDEMTRDSEVAHLQQPMLDILPLGALDGMNSAGVYVGLSTAPATGETLSYKPKTGLNADKKALPTMMMMRLLLDHATSLRSARELIKGTPWKETTAVQSAGLQLQWMVATLEGSFTCRFENGEPTFVESLTTDSAELGNMMAADTCQLRMMQEQYDQLSNYKDMEDLGKQLFVHAAEAADTTVHADDHGLQTALSMLWDLEAQAVTIDIREHGTYATTFTYFGDILMKKKQ